MQLLIRVTNLRFFLIFFEITNFINLDSTTLGEVMLKGGEKDTWISACEKVGEFLATTRDHFNKTDVAKLFPDGSIR